MFDAVASASDGAAVLPLMVKNVEMEYNGP